MRACVPSFNPSPHASHRIPWHRFRVVSVACVCRPIIAGYNLNDGGSFVGRPHSMDDTELTSYFATRFGPNVVDDLRATYPTPNAALPPGCTDSFMRASACETDWSYACETHMVADHLVAAAAARLLDATTDEEGDGNDDVLLGGGGFDDDGVYIYEFSQVSASSGLCLHGADVAYVFGTVSNSTSTDAVSVSKEVQRFWGNFARTGVPGTADADSDVDTAWPRWDASSSHRQLLNITAPQSYVVAPEPTCAAFFEKRWDYYMVCLPDNPELS